MPPTNYKFTAKNIMPPTNNKFDVGDQIKVLGRTVHHGKIGTITKVGIRRFTVVFVGLPKQRRKQFVAFEYARPVRTRPPSANRIIPSRPPPRRETSTSSENDSVSYETTVADNSDRLFHHLAWATADHCRSNSCNDSEFEAHIQAFADRLRTLREAPDSTDL